MHAMIIIYYPIKTNVLWHELLAEIAAKLPSPPISTHDSPPTFVPLQYLGIGAATAVETRMAAGTLADIVAPTTPGQPLAISTSNPAGSTSIISPAKCRYSVQGMCSTEL